MADKRINALANTAPSTASDDFIAVDGTTNGTRKLNAFSPTFGGNATVTGNLTVNGTGNSSFAGQLIQVADPATISLWKDATPTKAARFQFNTLADNGFSLGVYDGSSWFNAITVAPTTGVVKVPSTSASVTTITGSLVLSGGLGLAGAVNAGTFYGLVDGVTAPGAASGYARIYVDSADGDLKVVFGDGTIKTIVTDS